MIEKAQTEKIDCISSFPSRFDPWQSFILPQSPLFVSLDSKDHLGGNLKLSRSY